MTTQAPQHNEAFGIPADVEAELRKQADAEVAGYRAGLLEKFRAEAKAKLEVETRAEALELESAKPQDIDAFGFPKEYFKINIFKGQSKSEQSFVKVSVNGYAWQIERGKTVIVPSVVVDTLNHAITESVEQHEGGLITTPVQRFPFQVVGPATTEEYEAYKAANLKPAGSKAIAA